MCFANERVSSLTGAMDEDSDRTCVKPFVENCLQLVLMTFNMMKIER
jgi:hypothetical protein